MTRREDRVPTCGKCHMSAPSGHFIYDRYEGRVTYWCFSCWSAIKRERIAGRKQPHDISEPDKHPQGAP